MGYNWRIMWKRLAIFGGAALIVAAILVAVYYQQHNAVGEGYDIKCVQPDQPSLAANSLTCEIHPSQNTEQRHTESHWWDVLITWPEGITALLLMLTLFAICWQSWESHEQNRHMMNKERARIDVSSPSGGLELDDGPEWVDSMKVVYAGAEITVTNSGATRAFNVTAIANMVATPPISSIKSKEISLLSLPSTIPPNVEPIKADVITLLNDVNHVAAVSDGSEIIHLVGIIRYEDIFGKRHITKFRYKWDVEVKYVEGQSIDQSRWVKTKKGNEAT